MMNQLGPFAACLTGAIALLLVGCGSSTSNNRATASKWSLAESKCRAASNMVYAGDIVAIYGRLRRLLKSQYPELTEDPLLRSFSTGWQVVVPEVRRDDSMVTTTMQMHIELKGDGPYRIMVSSRSREESVNSAPGLSVPGHKTVQVSKPQREFIYQLKKMISEGLVDFASSCGGELLESRCDKGPRGTASEFSANTTWHDVVVSAPQLCEAHSAYIRVDRKVGKRRLGPRRAHGESGGFAEGCRELPVGPNDVNECPTINVFTVLHAAAERMRREGITVTGTGLGPCGVPETYEKWNASVAVSDWGHASRATEVLAELMTDYDLSGYVGVAVQGVTCSVEL